MSSFKFEMESRSKCIWKLEDIEKWELWARKSSISIKQMFSVVD